jgi:glycosyltransferase involved in cell wall biosynthesis
VEFIVINDGSTDKTEFVIGEFVRKYPIENLSIINISNVGLSGARNKGIELANGEFVWFLDGDDALVSGSTNEALFMIDKYRGISLFAFQGFDFEDRNLGKTIGNYSSNNDWLIESYNRIVERKEITSSRGYIIQQINVGKFIPNACFYIVKKDILLLNNLSFLIDVVYEDVLFTFSLFFIDVECLITDERLILHRRRLGSITRSKITAFHVDSLYRINDGIFKFSKERSYFRSEIYILIQTYLKIALRKTRDNGFSVFPYLFKYFELFMTMIKIPSVRQEIYKNIKFSTKLLMNYLFGNTNHL